MRNRLSAHVLRVALALPAEGIAAELASAGNPRVAHMLLHPTGEHAARFMIVAILVAPLTLLLPGWRGPRWLRRNCGCFGVAAFG
ncbi:hypothetical protein [Aliiruegeria haliotis]|nr:hypothetical protein [Aliiruegeria haliotis]